jgi:hypothetical protein
MIVPVTSAVVLVIFFTVPVETDISFSTFLQVRINNNPDTRNNRINLLVFIGIY